jgi:hypothetical protein
MTDTAPVFDERPSWAEVEVGDVVIAECADTIISGTLIDLTDEQITFRGVPPVPRDQWVCVLRIDRRERFESER